MAANALPYDRPMRRRLAGLTWDRAALLLLALALLVVLATFRDYGVTWDEPGLRRYGRLLVAWYASGLTDRAAFAFANLYYYGGAFDLLATLIECLVPLKGYALRHLIGGLIGVLGIGLTWRLGRRLGGPRTGLLAAVLLAVMPLWWGQMFFNSKDVPFAVGMLAALLAWLRCLDDWPHPRLGNVLLLGLTLGLALGVRVAGVLLAASIGFSILVLAVAQTRREGVAAAWWTGSGGSLRLLPAIPAALIVMVPAWPWVALAPGNFFDAIAYFGHFPYDGDILFAGRRYPPMAVPIAYWPTLLALTLPEAMLAGLLAALLLLPAAQRRHPCPQDRLVALLTVAFAASFPLAYTMLTRPPAYNGLRHFTFILPPLAVLAALGLDALRHRLPAPARMSFAYALAALCLLPVVRMVQLHPYEYAYFNDLSGGVRAAAGRFELDYWGTSFAELGRRLAPQLAARQGTFGPSPVPARICGPFETAQEVLPKSLLPVYPTSPGRLAIALAAFYCAEPPPGSVLAEVERAGVVLSRAYRVDAAAPVTRDD